ncbi:hypothetical protein CYMTET_43990 [Cymbomonas tetramitiformis]|uniref:START domain-containing protein n=1 Tax=Cymbomonas tetramitiformis TaxID=36881 RepID=A0AAE0F036_9CHLO|nr:hypothetical protein CYMTET_43990 [Cymbomonas tetramitiformis]
MSEPKFFVTIGEPQTSEGTIRAQTEYLIEVTTDLAEYEFHGQQIGPTIRSEGEPSDDSEEFQTSSTTIPDRLIRVRKTYNHFEKLYARLKKEKIPGADQIPPLPASKMFGTNDPKTIQKRVHGFQVFFDFISFNDELRTCAAVVEFLYACPMPDYEATKADIQEKAKQVYAMPASAWTLRQEKDGAKVMVAEMPGSSFLMVRTEVFLPLPLEDIMPLYKNNDLWKEWSPEVMFREIETLAEDNGNSVINVSYKIPVVDNRDTCFFSTEFPGLPDNPDKSGCMYIAAQSVQHPECPKRRGFVRANLMLSSTVFEAAEGGVNYTSFVHTDPCGKIPSGVVNQTLGSATKQLTDMRDIMIKKVKG